jgi:hypothetical protein
VGAAAVGRRVGWPVAVAGGVVLAAVVVVLGALLLRPSSTATVDGIAVECTGLGSTEACAGWGAAVLADGPRIHTFDPDDLARVRLTRPFPLPGECLAEYFIGRDPDDPAAREEVDCPAG